MLNKAHPLFRSHLHAARYSVTLLCRKPLATMMTVIVIAIALALCALFLVFTDNVNRLTMGWQQGAYISLYLKPDLTETEQAQVVHHIRDVDGVGGVTLKSSVEGLSELTQQEGMHDIMRYLPENPLPAVIEVTPALLIDSPAKLDLLVRQLKTVPQVEDAKLDMEWINRLHAFSGFASHVADALLVLLASAVALIIGNTLRLGIHNRYEEIQILKLIGATDSFILRPFLYSGILYGIAGALLAVFFVVLFLFSLEMVVNRFLYAYQMHYLLTGLSLRQILSLLLFAIILGWFGARLSVRRQLSVIEPQR